jgi:hypothetical protein
MTKYRSKTGPIPDDHWENEPGPLKGLDNFMSEEDIRKFEADTARKKREMIEREIARNKKS